MKAKNNYVFGGYTGTKDLGYNGPWSSIGRWVIDQDAFLLSIVNNTNDPYKAKCTEPENAILFHPDCGPCFGSCDLRISNN